MKLKGDSGHCTNCAQVSCSYACAHRSHGMPNSRTLFSFGAIFILVTLENPFATCSLFVSSVNAGRDKTAHCRGF